MEYGKVIRRALSITWHHKVLWLYGIAAALFGASGGGHRAISNAMRYAIGPGDLERWHRAAPRWLAPFPPMRGPMGLPFTGWPGSAAPVLGTILVILLLLLVVGAVGVIVRYTSSGALVGMVDEVERTERTSFSAGLRRGWPRFLRLLAIDLLIGLGSIALALVMFVVVVLGILVAAGPVLLTAHLGSGSSVVAVIWAVAVGFVVLLLSIAAILAADAAITLWREYAWRACVLRSRGVFDALGTGMQLLRRRLREGMLMWVLLLGIRLALQLITIPLALIGLGGVIGPALALYGLTQSPAAAAVVAVPGLAVFAVLALAVAGVFLTFRSAAWTLTYRELET